MNTLNSLSNKSGAKHTELNSAWLVLNFCPVADELEETSMWLLINTIWHSVLQACSGKEVNGAESPRAGEMQAFFDRVFAEDSQLAEFMAF